MQECFEEPEIFLTKITDIMTSIHNGEKDGRFSYWLQPEIMKGSRIIGALLESDL